MITIDKGEKHLFSRRLLQSDDTAIAWDRVVNIIFELSALGERTIQTWSKENGDVLENGAYADFELDTGDVRANDYYLKATLVVNDSTWSDGLSKDITWETTKIVVSDEVTTYNESDSTADIKFDVTAEEADPVIQAPSEPPSITRNTINDDGATFNRTTVARATDYEASIDSGTYNSVGTNNPYRISGQSGNTEFEHVLRGVNVTGDGPPSNSLTVLTKPDESPALAEDSKTSTTVTFDLTAISGTGTVTYFARVNGGAFQEVTVGTNTFSSLTPATAQLIEAYGQNGSGDGPIGSLTITTNAEVVAPTFDEGSFTNDVTTITALLTGGGPQYEFRIDNGAWVNTGATANYQFTELTKGTEYDIDARSTDGSADSSIISITAQTDDLTLQESSQENSFTTA